MKSTAPDTLTLLKAMGSSILVSIYITGMRRFAEFTYLSALPIMVLSLHTTRAALQITMLSFILGILIMQLCSAFVEKYLTIYRHLIISAILLIIGCVITIVTNNIDVITIGRFCEGSGAGLLLSISNVFIHDRVAVYFPQQHHSVTRRCLAYTGTISAWTPSIAIIIGGVLITAFSWRAAFYLVLVLAVILFILATALHKKNITPTLPNNKPYSIYNAYKHLLKSPYYLLLTLAFATCSTAIASYFIMIFFLFPDYHISNAVTHVSLLALAPAIGHFIGKSLGTKHWHFRNIITPLRLGDSLCFFCSLIFTALVLSHHTHLSLFIIQIIIYSIGAGVIAPYTITLIMHKFKQLKILANALLYAINSLFIIAGIWVIAHLHLNSPRSLALIFLSCSVIALVLSLMARHTAQLK